MVFRTKMDMSLWLPKPKENMFEYWTSFSPMAPMFGVPWRFADGISGPTTKAAVRPRARVKPVVVEEAEVVAVVPPTKPKPVPKTKAKPAPKAVLVPDDLTVIKGIGPKMAEKLAAKGIVSYAQIAKWRKPTVAKMDAELGGLPGAIARADWVGQAKALID